MKFLHTADIHLDSPLRGLERYEGAPVEAVRGATRRALENLVALAIAEQVAFVLIAGDLFDGDWKDYNTGLFFLRQVARLREAGIAVLAAAGNHDAASRISRGLRAPDNLHLFATRRPETRLLERHGVAVHGQGFATQAVTEDLAAGFPAALPGLLNIGLLHTSLTGREGHADYAPTRLDILASKGYDYWALGHVHRRELVAERPWVVFPGNLQGRHIGERGAKGATLVSCEEGEVREVRHQPLDLLRWDLRRIDITGLTTPDGLLEQAAAVFGEALEQGDGRVVGVRVELFGAGALHSRLASERERWTGELRALANEIGADRLWLEKVELRTVRAVHQDALALERDDALGGLLRTIRDLEADGERLDPLAAELADLRGKLPPSLLISGQDPTAPEALRGRLDEVKELLLARLLECQTRV